MLIRHVRDIERPCLKILSLIAMLGLVLSPAAWADARSIGVAVLETVGAQPSVASLQQLFKDEVVALFKGEYQIDFIDYPLKSDASPSQTQKILEQAYANPKTDMVLVLDIAANQSLGLLPSYAKPTFLPMVFDGKLLGYPLKKTVSGKKNLYYATPELDLAARLSAFRSVAPFTHAVLIYDARVYGSITPAMVTNIQAQAEKAGVDLTCLIYKGDVETLLDSIPPQTEAVLYGALPSVSRREIQGIINGVNARGLVSFSMGEAYVRLGALATTRMDTDWKKLARRTAIHMQDVFLGKAAESLPVFFDTPNRLMVNMATSRQIGYAPGFNVLSEATLINEDTADSNLNYSLAEVAHKALQANLDIAVQRFKVQIADAAVNESRGALLPRLDASISLTRRKETNLVHAGTYAESSVDGGLTLTQVLYSDKIWTAYAIQKYAHLTEKEILRQTELDIVQSAVNAYLNVLRQKTSLAQARYNLEITRRNYELAKNRVDVGVSDASDLYRWESELANAKKSVLAARSSLKQQHQRLNRLLHRPLTEEFTTTVETLENPALLINDKRFPEIISNSYLLERLADFFVALGLKQAPELKQMEARLASYQRQLKRDRRAVWLPEVMLIGEYTDNFDEDRLGGFPAEDDWLVGLQLSLPIFEGGAKSYRIQQSRLAVKQTETDYSNLESLVEQNIRNAIEAVGASYPSIDLAKTSEKASQKNFELVTESYAQGRTSITGVLDAQEALILAREASLNSVYTFLIDLMNLQRAAGQFNLFLTDAERGALSDDVMTHILGGSLQ